MYVCIAALHIHTAVSFKSNVTKIIIAGLLYCRSYWKRTSPVFRMSSEYQCVTLHGCRHARNVNSFRCQGKFNSAVKFHYFKEVRERWHIHRNKTFNCSIGRRRLFQEIKRHANRHRVSPKINPSGTQLYIHDKCM